MRVSLPQARWHVTVRGKVATLSAIAQLLITNEYWRSGGLDNLFEPKCITGLGCGKVARPVLLFER